VLEQYFEACERFLELESTDETPNQNWRAIDIIDEAAQAMWILAKLETKLLLKARKKNLFFSPQILTLLLVMFDGVLQ
jgi:hypothetical protein